MKENFDIKQLLLQLISHLKNENIVDTEILPDETLKDIVLSLIKVLKEKYPQTKLKRVMKSIHYANNFSDEELKEVAFLLDDVEQYLCINKILNHDEAVEYFNNRITSKGFVYTPKSAVTVMIESLLQAKR